MPPELGQETVPLFLSRAAALAAIEAQQNLIARPIEFGRIFYFALRTPGSAWPTDQNGKLPKYLKGEKYVMIRGEFLSWLAASLGLLCVDCGGHCYPNCISPPKKSSRRNRRKKVYLAASMLAEPTLTNRSAVTDYDGLSLMDLYRPLLQKIRRKRKPRTRRNIAPTSLELESAA